jgi:hypothetical protein
LVCYLLKGANMTTKKHTAKELKEWQEKVRDRVPRFYARVRKSCAPDNFDPNAFRFIVDDICRQDVMFSGYVEEHICYQFCAADGDDDVWQYGRLNPADPHLPAIHDVAVYWLYAGKKNRQEYIRYCIACLVLRIGRGESIDWLDSFNPPCPD